MRKLIFLLFITLLYPQNIKPFEIVLGNKTAALPSFQRGNSIFVEMESLASFFEIKYLFNKDFNKAEFRFPEVIFKFTVSNNFLVVTPSEGDTKTFQLPQTPLLINNKIFIPLNAITSLLTEFTDKRFEMSREKLFVSTKTSLPENDEPVVSTNNASIFVENKVNGSIVNFVIDETFDHTIEKFAGKIVLNIKSAKINDKLLASLKPAGSIEDIKVNGSDGEYSIEFFTNDNFAKFDSFKDGNSLMLAFYNNVFRNKTNKPNSPDAEKWKFDVIVLDPGHGGKDPGAIGVSGVREKEINLALALKLGKYIERRMPDVKVVYTRANDTFVELYKRGKIANENNGKLFISIHCNSMPKKPHPSSGFETYLLRPGKTDEAIKIAEFENSVISYEENPSRYQALTEENFILVSMAHSAFMRYSEQFADYLNQSLKQNSKLRSLGVKQAGFYVLVGASMPGVLFESGFLSNTSDEAFLDSDEGQDEIASQMFDAIVQYRVFYENYTKK